MFIGRKTNVDFLYHYHPLRHDQDFQYARQAIVDNEIFFSKFTGFNDPFDCIPVYDAPIKNIDDFIQRVRGTGLYSEDRLKNVEQRWKNGLLSEQGLIDHMMHYQIERISDRVGVYCLSSKKDDILMWSHYASSHSGVCLGFIASSSTPFFGEALEVFYTKDRPIINLFKDLDAASVTTFLTKNKDWEYENEYRMVSYNRAPGTHHYPKEFLQCVILGSKIKPEDEEKFRGIVRSIDGLKLFKTVLNNREYRMDVIPVDL
jgi:hypothetical protein